MTKAFSPWGTIHVSTPPAHRGGGKDKPRKFKIQSCNAVWAWGSGASPSTVVYVVRDAASAVLTDELGNPLGVVDSGNAPPAPVAVGAAIRLDFGGHTFYGRCRSDEAY